MPDNTLENDFIKHIAGDGKIELCLYSQRSKSGMPTWELKIKNTDGTRKIMIVRDYGFEISGEEIKINHFKTRAERNAEISRLYHVPCQYFQCQPAFNIAVCKRQKQKIK